MEITKSQLAGPTSISLAGKSQLAGPTSISLADALQALSASKKSFKLEFKSDGSAIIEPVKNKELARIASSSVPVASFTAYGFTNVSTPDQYIAVFDKAGFTPEYSQAAASCLQNNLTGVKEGLLFVGAGAASYIAIDYLAPDWSVWRKVFLAILIGAFVAGAFAVAHHYGIMK